MNRSIFVVAAAVAMAGTITASALADQKSVQQAVENAGGTVIGHKVLSVAPHWVQESNGKRTRRLIGADVRIQAEPGMTAEYLTVELQRGLSAPNVGRETPDDVFHVEGSSVQVQSTGDGFVFRITAPDATHAEEIVRRAHHLG
jgi:hypothetical protein